MKKINYFLASLLLLATVYVYGMNLQTGSEFHKRKSAELARGISSLLIKLLKKLPIGIEK